MDDANPYAQFQARKGQEIKSPIRKLTEEQLLLDDPRQKMTIEHFKETGELKEYLRNHAKSEAEAVDRVLAVHQKNWRSMVGIEAPDGASTRAAKILQYNKTNGINQLPERPPELPPEVKQKPKSVWDPYVNTVPTRATGSTPMATMRNTSEANNANLKGMVGQSAKSVSKDLSAGSNFKERLSGIIHNMPQEGAKLPTTLLRNLYNVPVKPEGWATWGKRLAGEVPKFLGF